MIDCQRSDETGAFNEEETPTFFTRRHSVPKDIKERDMLSKGMRLDSG